MKKAFIITSAIEVDNSKALTYSKIRSYFSNEERLRQTIATIASVDQATDDDTTMYLLDISDNWQQYRDLLGYQTNLKFISAKEQFPEIYDRVRSHPQKSHCECLLLATFMNAYKDELSEHDFQFKFSGRYILDRSFDKSLFNESSRGKIFYKRPLKHDWQEWWGYSMVDRRLQQNNNTLHQYCSVLFGWSKEYQSKYLDFFNSVALMLSQPALHHYDVETLGYYLTRAYESDIIETDWRVNGWLGPDGRFVRY
jgi:hypothetical protein